jgi:hypothetical protein
MIMPKPPIFIGEFNELFFVGLITLSDINPGTHSVDSSREGRSPQLRLRRK